MATVTLNPWAGGITINAPDVENCVATGDSNILAQICEQIVDKHQVRLGGGNHPGLLVK